MQLDILVPGFPRPYLDGDRLDGGAPLVARIAEFASADECAALIARIEALGPDVAPITTGRGFEMRPDVRNNARVMFDDVELAARLYARLAPLVPPTLCEMHPVGLNERFRGYRYTPGQRFAPHYDGAFIRGPDERSQLTFLLYLDEGCAGGATNFLEHRVEVTPARGAAVWFQHALLHEGAPVEAGVKYVLRSDVMYRAPW
ncbi:MAG: 2OG-Fe(II) oxygenase [Myxococcales bacterium]|nr:2OG-Fe(II) oxygenase [Myxococcales bacterium]